jgi:hypothetical protein
MFEDLNFIIKRMDMKYLSKDSKIGFALLAGINRVIKPQHVTKIASCLLAMGMSIRPVVVARIKFLDGIEKLYIIDGQHLYTACLRLNIEIPYIMVDVADKQDLVEKIAMCNASSRSWTLNDYITAWSSIKTDYSDLRDIITKYNVEPRLVVGCYMPTYGKSAATVIKKGEFVIKDRKQGDLYLNQLTDCMSLFATQSLWDKERFVNASLKLMRTNRHYNHSKFMSFLKENKREIVKIMSDKTEVCNFLEKAFSKK